MHSVMYTHPARRRRLLSGALAAALGALALTACGGGSSDDGPLAIVSAETPSGRTPGAITFDTPFAKPQLALTDQDGKAYELGARTKGRPLLLYFGYTYCPDVCPTTMADLAGALRQLPKGTPRPDVVFVSTDPKRDTPARLKKWLGAIDPSFVGLTGKFATIQAAARGLGIAVPPPVVNSDGSITVSHGAEVLAFSPKDDKAHVMFPSGTAEATYAADLPGVVNGTFG
ncbi:SCO family protein [Actinacidiphila alni]|uniref:SCO family protein n=1 Tax=Actinacidiphila alni TaxID=380248 RepID=UPI0033E2784D